MTRNLKALGLALVAAFALSAVAASAASATNHHVDGTVGNPYAVVGNTTQTFESTTASGEGYECEEVFVNGEVEAATATSVTVEPEYDDCYAFEEEERVSTVTVETNGCHYTFTGATTSGNPTGGEHATVHLTCPPNESITIRVTELKLKCAAIGEQEVADAVRYHDLGNGNIEITATAHGIDSTTEGFACGSGSHDNGSYTGNVVVTAVPNGLSLSTP